MAPPPQQQAPSGNWKALSKKLAPEQQKPQRRHGSTKVVTKNARMGTATATASKPTLVKSDEVWFDDVEQQALDRVYGQQISAQATERSLLDSSKKKLGRYLAVDCEMVGVGPDGVESALARVVVVNYHGAVLMDKYVRPQERVTDFRTAISGIEPKHLRDAHDFAVVQREVAELFKDRILVGHGLKNDLKCLLLDHPRRHIRDTAHYKPFRVHAKGRTPSLKKLAKEVLQKDIQDGSHCPAEDARTALLLYKMHKQEWDAELKKKTFLRAAGGKKK